MNRRIFLLFFFSFYSAHAASSIQTGLKLSAGGVCISLVGKNAGKGYETYCEQNGHLLGQQWTTFEGCYIQTIKLFFINKQTPRFGLLLGIQPIFFVISSFVLLVFKSVK